VPVLYAPRDSEALEKCDWRPARGKHLQTFRLDEAPRAGKR
jgi:hypothetical protein